MQSGANNVPLAHRLQKGFVFATLIGELRALAPLVATPAYLLKPFTVLIAFALARIILRREQTADRSIEAAGNST